MPFAHLPVRVGVVVFDVSIGERKTGDSSAFYKRKTVDNTIIMDSTACTTEVAAVTSCQSRLLKGDDDTLLLVHNSTVASPTARPAFDDPVHIYVPLLARRHANSSCQNASTLLLVDWH